MAKHEFHWRIFYKTLVRKLSLRNSLRSDIAPSLLRFCKKSYEILSFSYLLFILYLLYTLKVIDGNYVLLQKISYKIFLKMIMVLFYIICLPKLYIVFYSRRFRSLILFRSLLLLVSDRNSFLWSVLVLFGMWIFLCGRAACPV